MSLRVALVDPSRRVPGYDRRLAEALGRVGQDVHLLTGPPLFHEAGAAGVREHICFADALGAGSGSLARHPGVRRVLRAAEYPLDLARLRGWISKMQPDIIHFQWSLAPLVDAGYIMRLRNAGTPVVLTVHNVLPHERRPWHRRSFRYLYDRVDGVIVHSQATRARLTRLTPGPGARARVIPMPADPGSSGTGPRGADKAQRAAARRRVGIPPSAPVVLFFGQRRAYKGLDVLLEAVERVQRRLPEARLVVAGAGAMPPAEALPAGTVFRAAHVPESEADAFFAAADIVALPYIDTDDSAVLARALGAGRAVVASGVGGLPEALGPAGLVVPPGDAAALAAALERVLGDAVERARLESAAEERAAAWTWTDAAQETVRLYEQVAARRAWYRRQARPDPESPADGTEQPTSTADSGPRAWPTVSVVMPVRNGTPHLVPTLRALRAGSYPAERLEIIVADGGSADGSREAVAEMAEEDPRIRRVENPDGTTPAGLNAAIRASKGEIVVRLDAHALPAPDYVEACVLALERTGAAVVGGWMVGRGDTRFGEAVAAATTSPFGSGNAVFRVGGEGPADTVYLGAWRRDVLEALGGFDESLPRNQDYELAVRIREAGGIVWLDPAIRTVTATRGTPQRLARQYFDYGRGRAATVVRHPGSLRARQFLPAAFVAVLCGMLAAAPRSARARRTAGRIAFVYAAANLAAAVEIAPSVPPRVAVQLPAAFALMHLPWGVGFWVGAVREFLRRGGPTQ